MVGEPRSGERCRNGHRGNCSFALGLMTAVLLGASGSTSAGGWVVISLDATPTLRAGQPTQMRLTMLRHGVTLESEQPSSLPSGPRPAHDIRRRTIRDRVGRPRRHRDSARGGHLHVAVRGSVHAVALFRQPGSGAVGPSTATNRRSGRWFSGQKQALAIGMAGLARRLRGWSAPVVEPSRSDAAHGDLAPAIAVLAAASSLVAALVRPSEASTAAADGATLFQGRGAPRATRAPTPPRSVVGRALARPRRTRLGEHPRRRGHVSARLPAHTVDAPAIGGSISPVGRPRTGRQPACRSSSCPTRRWRRSCRLQCSLPSRRRPRSSSTMGRRVQDGCIDAKTEHHAAPPAGRLRGCRRACPQHHRTSALRVATPATSNVSAVMRGRRRSSSAARLAATR